MRKVVEVKHKQICSFALKPFCSVIFSCIVFHYHLIKKHFSCRASRKLKNFICDMYGACFRGIFRETSHEQHLHDISLKLFFRQTENILLISSSFISRIVSNFEFSSPNSQCSKISHTTSFQPFSCSIVTK